MNRENKNLVNKILKTLKDHIGGERDVYFYNTFPFLKSKQINEEIAKVILDIYEKSKLIYIKNTSIKLLFNKRFPFLEAFFRKAYKKHRPIDMKMSCIRGLAQFASEDEINRLVEKINILLKKRIAITLRNYQEYIILKGKHCLPYLIKRYGYECFKQTLEIVENHYRHIPDTFKNKYTTDEDGKIIYLISDEEWEKWKDKPIKNFYILLKNDL